MIILSLSLTETYDSDLQRAKNSLSKLIYEHYIRRPYDYVSESYPRKPCIMHKM